MDDTAGLSEADLDRLLAGKTPLAAQDTPVLRNFFRDLRSRYVVEPPPAVREAHIAQMISAARLAREHKQPLVAPGGPAGNGKRPRYRRQLGFGSVFGSIAAKVLTAAVAAAAATGGLAAAGALPKPVQAAVASAAGELGVHLPGTQASGSASSNAQAQKLAATVSTLVQEATTAASTPGAFRTTAVTSAATCAQRVGTTASHLAAETGNAATASFAQSLAARAAALAQESVGCAIPVTGTGAGSPTTAVSSGAQSAIGRAIVTTIQGCSAPLKSAVETLVQAALGAGGATQSQTVVTDARAVAAAAQTCAQGIESAIRVNLPATASLFPTPSGAGTLQASTPAVPPSSQGTSQPPATPAANPSGASIPTGPTATSPLSAAAWLKLLSSLPSNWGEPGGVTSTATSGGSGSWSGRTGSWTTSGSWSPYSEGTDSSQTQPAGTSGTHTDH